MRYKMKENSPLVTKDNEKKLSKEEIIGARLFEKYIVRYRNET